MPKVRQFVDGWVFWCPGCQTNHATNSGWTFNGDVEKPTFKPSILVNGNVHLKNPTVPRCHSYVTDGRIQFLGDSTHHLAGQTVDLEEID